MMGVGTVEVAQVAAHRRVCLRCAPDVQKLAVVHAGFTCADCGEVWGKGGLRKWYLFDGTKWRVSQYGISSCDPKQAKKSKMALAKPG
jgi:hypothetical protein